MAVFMDVLPYSLINVPQPVCRRKVSGVPQIL
jgi:hypothetical protein